MAVTGEIEDSAGQPCAWFGEVVRMATLLNVDLDPELACINAGNYDGRCRESEILERVYEHLRQLPWWEVHMNADLHVLSDNSSQGDPFATVSMSAIEVVKDNVDNSGAWNREQGVVHSNSDALRSESSERVVRWLAGARDRSFGIGQVSFHGLVARYRICNEWITKARRNPHLIVSLPSVSIVQLMK